MMAVEEPSAACETQCENAAREEAARRVRQNDKRSESVRDKAKLLFALLRCFFQTLTCLDNLFEIAARSDGLVDVNFFERRDASLRCWNYYCDRR